MHLAAGTRLGPYDIVSLLGTGGMGEVYRARDTKLNRDVALKILSGALTLDEDRTARFRREAQVLAALNHPNIAQIYGFEDSASTHALVLELVEGRTLADRIAEGPVAVDEALHIAKQIADALGAAHDLGIVHRDLKPANIKLRPDGTVKVLDFGLAKALEPPSSDHPAQATAPTITTPAQMTAVGVILGTAAYMSPEQARGLAVDKRADIWSFGVVLYELLAGRRAFEADSVPDTLAAVLRAEPDMSALPPATPRAARVVLERCLRKDPSRRLRDIVDARFELEESVVSDDNERSSGARTRWIVAMAATALVAAAAGYMVRWSVSARSPSSPVVGEMHVDIATPASADQVSLAVSPDGQTLVYVALSDRRPKLWLRSLATGATTALAGSDGASFPFWSPDSRSIGYFANGNLNRIDVDGGTQRMLATAPVGTGGTWGVDGTILFTMVPDAPISRVSANGGPATLLPRPPEQRSGHRFPQFLPDGRHFLYYVAESAERGEYTAALDGSDRRRLFDADGAAVFVPPSRVLYVRGGTLFVQHLDAARRQVEGDPVPLAQGIRVDAVGAAAISASPARTVAFRAGSIIRQRQFEWFDRSGQSLGTVGAPDPAVPMNPSLSPDGSTVLLNRSVDGNVDIWTFELNRHVFTRWTFGAVPDIYPIWSPDGHRIVYAHMNQDGRGAFTPYEKAANDTGDGMPIVDTRQNIIPLDWSRDGRFVLFMAMRPSGGWDLGAVPMVGSSRAIISIARTTHNEETAQFSPDGHWIALESDESGRSEIYVQSFPDPSSRIIISTGGGISPRWSPAGGELFYVAPDGRLMAVALKLPPAASRVEPAAPLPLFMTRVESTHLAGSGVQYAVSADGRRFLMNTFLDQATIPISLIVNSSALKD